MGSTKAEGQMVKEGSDHDCGGRLTRCNVNSLVKGVRQTYGSRCGVPSSNAGPPPPTGNLCGGGCALGSL